MPVKKFDQKLHNENDHAARKAVMKWWRETYPFTPIRENEDIYGHDLIIGDGMGFVEVEVKRVWKGAGFPWNSLQIPARKQKFITEIVPTYFFVLNATFKRAIKVRGDDLIFCAFKNIDTIYTRDEPFFDVPIKYMEFIEL